MLSVIIASYNSRGTIDSCLKSLDAQRGDGQFEVIVVDSSTDGTAQIIREKFPWVDLYVFPQRMYCGDARNFGISVARGDIVAFIDADCTADGRWISEILKAHESPHLAIGGSIGNGNPESYVGWAAYFSEFSQWMPAKVPRALEDIAGANMSYKKEAFGRFGGFIEGTYCSDTEFHWRLKDAGHHVLFSPSVRVYHKNIPCFGRFLIHEFHHGLSFARVRIRKGNFSFLRRFSYASLVLLIVVWLFSKIAWRNVTNPVYLKDFLITLPLVVLGVASWSLGELVGYVKGGD